MKSNKYTVQTVSIIQHGSVIEEYYVGNDRNKANQILTDLQKKELTRIQLIDKESDKLFQYDCELPTHAIGDGLGFRSHHSEQPRHQWVLRSVI